jgi:outer membrane lipoprotein-sorting protein
MKKFMLLFLVGGLIFNVNAQQDDAQKAKKILDDLSIETKKFKTISIDFKLSIKGGEVNSSSSGKAKIKGKSFYYETEDRKVFSDGVTVWTYLIEENECYIDNLGDVDGGINPSELLNIWEKNFKYVYSKEISTGVHEIKLFPIDTKKSKYHTVILTVDSVKKRISKVVIKTNDNVLIQFTISILTPNQEIGDDVFKWNKAKFKGVIEIENR